MSKTNLELVNYCRHQLGNPYWFGTYGQLLNSSVWREKQRQYPSYYSEARHEKAKARGDYGRKGHDCAGLIKGYLMLKEGLSYDTPTTYDPKYDISADGMYKLAKEKGDISTIPEIIGLGVHRNGHIGVYIGNGKVIEAKGFDYGVITSDLKGSTFKHWLKIPNIDYVEKDTSKIAEFVERLYTNCLGRNSDPSGKQYWVNVLATEKGTGRDVAYGFFFSLEFLTANYSNKVYVQKLYHTFLGREPDSVGFNDWVRRLDSGKSRAEVLDGFARSREFEALCNKYDIRPY